MSNKPQVPTWKRAIKNAYHKFTNIDKERALTELGFAAQIIEGNEKLQQCSEVSIENAIINIARTSVTLNPALRLAYLVPRKGKCILDFSYMGLIGLLTEHKVVKYISAINVYEDEKWAYDPITDKMIHTPVYPRTEKEHKLRVLKGTYSRAVLMNDMVVFNWMPYWELEKIKNTSQYTKEGSVWDNWEEEMWKKTALRRHYKLLIGLGGVKNKALENIIDVEFQQVSDDELPENKLKEILSIEDNKVDYIQPTSEAKSAFNFQMPEKELATTNTAEITQQPAKQQPIQSGSIPEKMPSAIENARMENTSFTLNTQTENQSPVQNEQPKQQAKIVQQPKTVKQQEDLGFSFKTAFEVQAEKKQQEKLQQQEVQKEKSVEEELGFSLDFGMEESSNDDAFLNELNAPKKFRFEE